MTSGFLRSSNQVDKPDSTALFTDPTYLGAQSRDLSPTAYSLVKIPIDPIAHTFRAGTALRVVVSAPGGDRPVWAFDTIDDGQQATVGLGGWTPSALMVNEVGGVTATARTPCLQCVARRTLPGVHTAARSPRRSRRSLRTSRLLQATGPLSPPPVVAPHGQPFNGKYRSIGVKHGLTCRDGLRRPSAEKSQPS